MRSRLVFVLGTVVAMMAAGCARATQSQLPLASGPLTDSRVRRTSASENVIYSFAGGSGSIADGAYPRAGLISVNSTLYGTTSGAYGTVFSITPSGKETVLHSFKGYPSDGATISDDLNDIHRDLMEGLVLLRGGHIANALWHWHVTHYTHWGRHLSHAQSAIWKYLSRGNGG